MNNAAIKKGIIDTLPLSVGAAFFGIVYGVMCKSIGFPIWGLVGMSTFVFAGASQMLAAQMVAVAASPLSIIIMIAAINLRHYLMALSINEYIKDYPFWKRFCAHCLLTDEGYTVSLSQFIEYGVSLPYMFACELTVFVFWGIFGVLGYFFGNLLPDGIEPLIGFVMPAAFISMSIPFIKNKPTAIAVAVSATASLIGRVFIPGKWYVIVACLLGSVVGALLTKEEA